MEKKKIVIGIAAAVVACLCAVPFLFKNEVAENSVKENTKNAETVQKVNKKSVTKNVVKEIKKTDSSNTKEQKDEKIIKTDLYSDSNAIPFSVITQLADITPDAKKTLEQIAESNNVYMINKKSDKLLLVIENPGNIRHGVDFVEISLKNGHQTRSTLGYSDKMQDSDNDIWEYDKSSQMPIPTKHTKFDKDGNVEFVEVWNYDSENPIKYEMKNGEGKVISVKKETQSGDTDLRVENIVYDHNGKTKISVSTTYEGSDLKRFTYYNADRVSDGGSVFSEYTDGAKTKETIYTSDLKLKNIYNSAYKDGLRTEIDVYNSNNEEVAKYTQKDAD